MLKNLFSLLFSLNEYETALEILTQFAQQKKAEQFYALQVEQKKESPQEIDVTRKSFEDNEIILIP